MNLVSLLLGVGVFFVLRGVLSRWLEVPMPEHYLRVDLPPIQIPKSQGISSEGILHQFIPKVESMYVPPGVKLVWPGRINIGPIQIECPIESRVLKLPARYDKRGVDAVRLTLAKKFYETKVRSTDGQWEVDFPEVIIPLGG